MRERGVKERGGESEKERKKEIMRDGGREEFGIF